MGVCGIKPRADKSLNPHVRLMVNPSTEVSFPRYLTICKPPLSLISPSSRPESTGDCWSSKPPSVIRGHIGSLTSWLTGALSAGKQSEFEEKRVERFGDELPEGYFKDRGIAAVCKKGLKPETQNQDDYCIVVQEGVLMLGVFDGHGPSGHQVSACARTAVPSAVASHSAFKTNPEDCFEPSFEQIQNEMRNRYREGKKGFDCVMSGTTATLAVVTDEAYFVGHVGDSRAVLSKLDTLNGTRTSVQVTTDHRPSLPAETERIEAMGGEVKLLKNDPFHRVFLQGKDYPGLAMSRAIGDLFAEQVGVIATPDVYFSQIQPEDEFLLICSDGVWEFISNTEAVEAVAALGKLQAAEAAEVLAKLAWQRWHQREEAVVDDITVLIVYLH